MLTSQVWIVVLTAFERTAARTMTTSLVQFSVPLFKVNELDGDQV